MHTVSYYCKNNFTAYEKIYIYVNIYNTQFSVRFHISQQTFITAYKIRNSNDNHNFENTAYVSFWFFVINFQSIFLFLQIFLNGIKTNVFSPKGCLSVYLSLKGQIFFLLPLYLITGSILPLIPHSAIFSDTYFHTIYVQCNIPAYRSFKKRNNSFTKKLKCRFLGTVCYIGMKVMISQTFQKIRKLCVLINCEISNIWIIRHL